MSSKIEVVKIQRLDNGGKLLGFASVRLGGIIIHDWRIVKHDDGPAWVTGPQKVVEKNGERKYLGIIYIENKALMDEITNLIMAKYDEGEPDPDNRDDPPY